ncbi:O-antigen ligase family protein [Nocardioides jiangxiensis]|uniref:O-antigen ligase-related domain-containing protein n=1 Tax=Nocardioides jiangxiensis TaxID=3064524 RepID=A0ABT9AZ33_9ACTN|nr:O-antigen ligase family protein [Nocardioides sp. WY-20]MDO7867846.1 hypothetical protein [Nocardioides sp. WY-20]
MQSRGLVLNAAGAIFALGLVYLSFGNLLYGEVAIVVCLGLGLLVLLGPDRLGLGLMVLGYFLAPQDNWRPSAAAPIAFSDVVMALGFALMAPRLLANRIRLPLLFTVGAFGVIVTTLATSALAASPSASISPGIRLIFASVLLPAVIVLWGPSTVWVNRLLGAYVVGQVFSTIYGLAQGALLNNRYQGTTTHPNFFGMCGLLSVAACFHLYFTVRREYRWLVVLGGLVALYSITLSGSRGALLAAVLIIALFPFAERSALSIWGLIMAAVLAVPGLNWLVSNFPDNPLVSRVFGGEDKSVGYSDDVRTNALHQGWDRFLGHPIIGSGYDQLLETHNIYLQVAIAIGALGLGAWLVMVFPFVSVLTTSHPLHRLGYISLAYLAIGMTEPSLWERMTWAPMSLALLAALPGSHGSDDEPSPAPDASDASDAQPPRRTLRLEV